MGKDELLGVGMSCGFEVFGVEEGVMLLIREGFDAE